jgi:uncharacterized OB-fold protein
MKAETKSNNDQSTDREPIPTVVGMVAIKASRCIACGTVTFDARIPCHECRRRAN